MVFFGMHLRLAGEGIEAGSADAGPPSNLK